MALAEWNRAFEAGAPSPLPPDAWDHWLWRSRLHDAPTAVAMLNEMHLLGLLIARYRARFHPATMEVRLSTVSRAVGEALPTPL